MFPHGLRLVIAQVCVSALPVLLFLFALELIDTYKLLTLGRVLRSVAVGCGAAVVCYAINTAIYALGIASPAKPNGASRRQTNRPATSERSNIFMKLPPEFVAKMPYPRWQ